MTSPRIKAAPRLEWSLHLLLILGIFSAATEASCFRRCGTFARCRAPGAFPGSFFYSETEKAEQETLPGNFENVTEGGDQDRWFFAPRPPSRPFFGPMPMLPFHFYSGFNPFFFPLPWQQPVWGSGPPLDLSPAPPVVLPPLPPPGGCPLHLACSCDHRYRGKGGTGSEGEGFSWLPLAGVADQQ